MKEQCEHRRERKNWFYLFSANFFGILNDNFMKHCIVFIAVTWALPAWMTQSQVIAAVSAALVIPYLIFSPLSGKVTLQHAKHKIFKICKLLEFPIVALAIAGFVCNSLVMVLLAVLLMGIQSCMYSPSKYGLIKDIGGAEKVSFGSGVFETMSFLAILAGTCLAAWLSDNYHHYLLIIFMLVFAALGYGFCSRIRVEEEPSNPADAGTANPFLFTKQSFRYARRYANVNAGVLGVSVFWLVGGLLQMNMVLHCTHTLAQSNTISGIVLAIAATGIAAGCTICGKLCSCFKPQTLIVTGLSVMILCITAIVLFNPGVYLCAALIFITAAFGGCFEVPCLSMIQQANTGRKNGDMLAYMNLATFIFVLIGSGIFSLVTWIWPQNSLAVFVAIIIICVLTLLYFAFRKNEQKTL